MATSPFFSLAQRRAGSSGHCCQPSGPHWWFWVVPSRLKTGAVQEVAAGQTFFFFKFKTTTPFPVTILPHKQSLPMREAMLAQKKPSSAFPSAAKSPGKPENTTNLLAASTHLPLPSSVLCGRTVILTSVWVGGSRTHFYLSSLHRLLQTEVVPDLSTPLSSTPLRWRSRWHNAGGPQTYLQNHEMMLSHFFFLS